MAEALFDLKTSDGQIFHVKKNVLSKWGYTRSILELYPENEISKDAIPLDNVDSAILKKIIMWTEKHIHDPQLNKQNETASKRQAISMSDSDRELIGQENTVIFGIMNAASYLNIDPLIDMTAQLIAEQIRGKTPGEVRKHFNLPDDLPPDQRLD